MIFIKGGRISDDLSFTYGDMEMEIVSKFTYLGIVFTSGGSLNVAQKTLSDQALKAIFILNKYLTKSDKLISPILCYGSEVWGFNKEKIFKKFIFSFVKDF